MTFDQLELAQGVNEHKSNIYRSYFRAKQTPRNTSVMSPPEFRVRYFTALSFCRTACQVISERIEMDSVLTDNDDDTKFLNEFLKDLGGADFVNTVHMTAMEYGRAYLVPTGTDSGDVGVQIVPGRDMVHALDPYTGEITEALRTFGRQRESRIYYTPKYTQVFTRQTMGWQGGERVPTANGKIGVFPVICRDEVGKPWGRPEAKDIFTIQDSACRVATDMAVTSATMATPQRVIAGVEEEDFTVRNPDGSVATDPTTGDPLKQTGEELYMSRLLLLSEPAAKLSEFTAAQLQNFTTALNFLVKQAAATMGVPQSVFGVASDSNPTSGEAIRQDDARLIRRAEQITRGFERGWVPMFQYILAATDRADQNVRIRWVDPSLPNLASRADAVAKMAAITVGESPLYDWEDLRRKLGDSQEDIDAAQQRRERDQLNRLLTTPSAVQELPQQPVQRPATAPVS